MEGICIDINIKLIEILSNLVLEQNKQLLQIIADEEGLSYHKIMNFLPSQYDIKEQLKNVGNNHGSRLEKSNSISESSLSTSEPEVS